MATPMGPQQDESDDEVVIAPQRRLSDWLRADSPDGKEHDPSDARTLNERSSPAESPFMAHMRKNTESHVASEKRREEREEELDRVARRRKGTAHGRCERGSRGSCAARTHSGDCGQCLRRCGRTRVAY